MSDAQALPDIFKHEAIGDWSGLKGTYYHLLYAVYLLLVKHRPVTFYSGNDLLSTLPAEMHEGDDFGVRTSEQGRDDWIQLKNVSEDRTWTVHKVLFDERLLFNLILNGLMSEFNGKNWTATLTTPARIAASEIRDFLYPPKTLDEEESKRQTRLEAHQKLVIRLQNVVEDAEKVWQKWLDDTGVSQTVDSKTTLSIALRVLEQIARCERMSIQMLIDGIEKALLKIYPDEQTVRQVVQALNGAIAGVGRAATAQPLALDLEWLENQTGFGLLPRDLLMFNTVEACEQQVAHERPEAWSESKYTVRKDLEDAFAEFLSSSQTLFVLTGDSGAGKSWAVVAAAALQRAGSVRALISGTELDKDRSLTHVIAEQFRHLARPDASDETIFRYLLGAAADPARGPFVLFADDLPLSDNPTAFENNLERLCREARQHRLKLVFVARASVWQRLCRQLKLEPFLFRRATSIQESHPHILPAPTISYQLNLLTDAELEEILRRQLGAGTHTERSLLAVLRPEFSALRNPYLLSIYLKQVKADETALLVPPTVDTLLKLEIRRRFQRVGLLVDCEPDEIINAQEHFITCMWKNRRDGTSSTKLMGILDADIPGKGRNALRRMQQEDILTSPGDLRVGASGNVTYANPQFGEQLTADWLASRLKRGEDVLAEMEPGLDDGVLSALARGSIDGSVPDVFAWVEQIIQQDPRWLLALAQGVSQRSQSDWRIPAILVAWSRRDIPSAAYHTMRALGTMAGRSSYARASIAALYADEDSLQDFYGGIALGSALDVAPRWVERRIRVRLRRELSRQPKESQLERQYQFIRNALAPLREVSHGRAAVVARRLLDWIKKHPLAQHGSEKVDVRKQFDDIAQVIRGRIALHGTEADLQAILGDLESDDHHVRAGAARSLLPFVQERPDRVKAVVLEATTREEQVPVPFLDLLYLFADRCPEAVATTIEKSNVLRSCRCGIALMTLARIGLLLPERVQCVLPERLDRNGIERALLNEGLVFAWWQSAATASATIRARRVLEQLSISDFEGVDDHYRVYALRNASVALLAQIALDIEGMSEAARDVNINYHHLALETNWGFTYADLENLCHRFAPQIAAHPLFSAFIEMSAEALRAYTTYEMHPVRGLSAEWQFRVANLCTDLLCSLAAYIPNPDELIVNLPRDWPTIRISRAILNAGHATDVLITYACDICQEHHNVIGGNIVADRDAFLFDLQSMGRVPDEHRELVERISKQSEYGVSGMDAETDEQPEVLLDQLHLRATPQRTVPFLWEWSSTPRDWRGALIGNVFRTMWSKASISLSFANSLCEQMLVALNALPPAPRREQWIIVYSLLREFCSREPVSEAVMQSLHLENDLLCRSHQAALTVVARFQAQAESRTQAWYEEHVRFGDGLIADEWYRIEQGNVVHQSGHAPSVYFFPATRLALAIASAHDGIDDFPAQWTRRWLSAGNGLQEGSLGKILRYPYDSIPEHARAGLLMEAEREVEALLQTSSRDVRLLWAKGHILLLEHRFDAARDALLTCLQSPAYGLSSHDHARYDLACTYARLGELQQCQALVGKLLSDEPNRKSQIANDPDFASVRNELWFRALISDQDQEAVDPHPEMLDINSDDQ